MLEASGSCVYPSPGCAAGTTWFRQSAIFTPFRIEDVETSIPARFEKIVALHRARLAVKAQSLGAALTYGELNSAANRTARAIVEVRGTASEPVALLFEQGTHVIAAIMAVLKAGKFFVALDPAFPRDWNRHICEDAGARMILTSRDSAAIAHSLASQSDSVIVVDDLEEQAVADNLGIEIASSAIAGLIYTSGSTGVPKAVVQNHRNFLHATMRRVNSFQISVADRLTLLSSGFNQALMNIFSALLSGACVCPFHAKKASTRALVRWLQDEEITIYHSSASLFREVLDALSGDEDLSRIRLIRSASEAVTKREIQSYAKHFSSDCVYVTGLSTTETGTATLNFIGKGTFVETDRVPIGYPLQDIDVLLLDDRKQPVPAGSIGEIAIRSKYISPGYWRKEDLTAAKFLADPEGGDRRIFLTGDSGRQLNDGRFEHLGRKDLRLKIRGYGVEPGEVEAKLLTHPQIKEAAVIGTEADSGESRLIGYFVATRTPGPSVRELRDFLGTALPDFMIPSAFVALDVLPRTLNGKVDRRALRGPARSQPSRADALVKPRTAIERELARMWQEVLRIEEIGVHDDFFDLGGHSLAATRIANRVAETFDLELSLRCLLQCPTIAEMAALIAPYTAIAPARHEEKQRAEGSTAAGSRERSAPLSHAQTRLWFLDQLHPGSSTYNLFSAYRIEGDLDVALLEHAFNEIVGRHEILRTVFKTEDGDPLQIVLPTARLTIPVHDLRATAEIEDRWTKARRICKREAQGPFDLSTGPLLRVTLIRLADDEYVLLRAIHHVVFDGWSEGILLGELCEIYNALVNRQAIPLPDLPIQYVDFSRAQRQATEDESVQRQLAYWREQLNRAAPLHLPTDRPGQASRSSGGARRYFALSEALSSGLIRLSRESGATLFTTLLAAYQTLLHRYTGQTDIVIGCPFAGRNRREVERLIGFFVNMLVLRLDLSGNPTFTEALARAREVCLGALSHQDVRFEKVVEEIHPDRHLDRNPLFQVTFAFQNTPCVRPKLPGLKVEELQVETGIARFDLHLVIEEVAGRLEGYFDYDTNLFRPATIERMVGHFENLLKALVEDPHRRISDLPLLSESEHRQLVVDWNDTGRDYPGEKCVQELFEAQVETTPDAIALVFADEQLTYGELNARANQLARYLRRLGVAPDSLVGVCINRSFAMVVALLGILKAGSAYVPLDPAYPEQRLAFMLQDAQIGLVLTDSGSVTRLPSGGARYVCLDREWHHISTERRDNFSNGSTSANLAYVIYTSGSTGSPKGVEVRHRGIVRLLFGIDYVQLDSTRTLLHTAPISFDAATFELWGALLHGCKCVLFPAPVPGPRELGAFLQRHSIDTLWLTTALFNTVIDEEPRALSGVKQLLIGGEALSMRHVKKGLELLPHTRITNCYGPTENTTFTSCYLIPRQLDDTLTSVPIGKPIANTRIFILDPHLKPVPVGVAGELYIGGDGLARGYLNRGDVTAERFVADPFRSAAGSKLYKSGDLARYLPDGNIEFLGRLDDQVKIRGFRIEPGEVEATLKQCTGVRQCAVTARTDDSGDEALVAYVVAGRDARLDAQRLRAELRATLPEYMVPSAFVFLPSIPLSPSGKVDRRALPHHLNQQRGAPVCVGPRTAVEQALADIWADILRLDRISVDDNFFDLGGHSLMGTKLMARVCSDFGIDVPLRRLFEHPTIAGLAESLEADLIAETEERSVGSPWRYLIELKRCGSGQIVFFLPGGLGRDFEFLIYARLIHFVDGPFSFYGLRARSAEGTQNAHADVEEMAADYLKEIRALQPEGPYFIVGNCVGGIVAYEIAQQLTAQGQSVALLALMDTSLPTRERYRSYRKNLLKDRLARHIESWRKSYHVARLPFHWQQVQQIAWQKRGAYIVRKAAVAMRDLAFGRSKVPHAQAADGHRLVDEFRRRDIQEGYIDALRRYRPRPYSGRVAILVNEDAFARDPATGWAELIRGGVTVRNIPGDHTAYIREHVRTAARVLKECLEEACAAEAEKG